MSKQASPELLALNKKEGKPLDLLREALDVLEAEYKILSPEEGDSVIRKYGDIYLDPFLEPDSVIFPQRDNGLVYLLMVEQLSKVKCVSFRTQISKDKILLSKTDLINTPPTNLEDLRSGRILIEAMDKDLRLLFETAPGDAIGQSSCSVKLPGNLKHPSTQTLEISLLYEIPKGNPYLSKLIGRISVWHW